MAALSHVKSNSIGDFTGTVTVFNSQGSTQTANATDLVRPGDWNSAHNFFQTISGDTAGQSTASGTNLVFGATNGGRLSLSTAAGAATLWMEHQRDRTFIPYYPASTSSQTIGGFGTTTASAWVFPMSVYDPIEFNELRILQSQSFVSSTVSGQQTITSQYGLYTRNGATLSQISSGSFSLALTVSSVSATLSYPNATGTAGYTYGTTTVTATAQAQSFLGTVGNRVIGMQFGNSMSLSGGLYWLGVHQRQSTSSAAVGISTAFVGNNMGAAQSVAGLGQASSAVTSGGYHFNWGPMTSTGLAGHSGTALPSTIAVSGIANTVAIMPMVTFIST